MTVSGNDVFLPAEPLLDVSGGDASGSQTIDYDVIYAAVYDAAVDALAASQTVTDGQALNSTAISYFTGILGNKILPVDYVAYVGDSYYYWSGSTQRVAYEYCLAYGDLQLSGTHFTGTGTIVKMRLSGDVSVTVTDDQVISLSAPMYYSRSNLGSYAGIYQYNYSGFGVLLCLVLGGVVWFLKKLLNISY